MTPASAFAASCGRWLATDISLSCSSAPISAGLAPTQRQSACTRATRSFAAGLATVRANERRLQARHVGERRLGAHRNRHLPEQLAGGSQGCGEDQQVYVRHGIPPRLGRLVHGPRSAGGFTLAALG
jgi:hypothetical protein